jgi:hypothetical protein
MLAIPNQRVDLIIGDAEVWALRVRTGEALSRHSLWCSPPAFHLAPGTHRRGCWLYTQRGSGGETTSGAVVWRAGLEQTLGS